jgi:cell division protein FtsB
MKIWRRSLPHRPVGWSVIQPQNRKGPSSAPGERYLRNLWVSRKGGFYRLALLALALWGAYSVVGSSHGLLQLRALAREEAGLKAQLSEAQEESRLVQNELQEGAAVGLERGLREKYLKSRPNEIVYHLRRTEAAGPDSIRTDPSGEGFSGAEPQGESGAAGDRTGDSAGPSAH